MLRAFAFSVLVLTTACSLVVDDRLGGKPSEQGVGGVSVGTGGGSTAATGGFGGGSEGGFGGAVGGFGGSGGTPIVCKIHDDFDDGVVDTMWDAFTTTSSNVALSETDGALEIAIPAGAGNRWGRVRTSGIPTDGCGATVRYLSNGGAPNGDELAYVELRETDTLRAGFHLHGATLEFWTKNGPTETAVSSVPYDAATHAWWRLRPEGDDLVWETSDGARWVERERTTSHFDLSAAEITLGAGVYEGATSDGLTVRYDDLNVNAPP